MNHALSANFEVKIKAHSKYNNVFFTNPKRLDRTRYIRHINPYLYSYKIENRKSKKKKIALDASRHMTIRQ